MNKITHLIPATEFILQYHEPDYYETMELDRVANEIYNYAIFLSQPLQEWMFVGEGAYFVWKPQFDKPTIKHHITQNRTLEYFANFGSLELTPKALEQIYGSETAIKKATE